jgi:FKBP-type peptidyl-prolyl cis-trans isomerase FklB
MKIQLYGLILSLLLAVPGIQAATAASTTNSAGGNSMQSNQPDAGIVTLPSGLQYKILEEGTGKKPGPNDTVTVDYEGTLENGTVFDSSYKRGQPATFPVSGVIAGWVEALQLMNVGSTWMLYIPPQLAYGERGAGDVIGPNQKLIFKVHLISIQ